MKKPPRKVPPLAAPRAAAPANNDAALPGPHAADFPDVAAISARAYELWEQSGGEHGRDQEHWHRAVRELRERKGED